MFLSPFGARLGEGGTEDRLPPPNPPHPDPPPQGGEEYEEASALRLCLGRQRLEQALAARFDQVERAFVVALGAAIGIGNVDRGEHPGPFGEPARGEAPEPGEGAALPR